MVVLVLHLLTEHCHTADSLLITIGSHVVQTGAILHCRGNGNHDDCITKGYIYEANQRCASAFLINPCWLKGA